MKVAHALACLAASVSLQAATPSDCQKLRYHGQLAEARRCFTGLTASTDPYIRAEGLWGIEQYQDANAQFRLAVQKNPKSAEYRVRWGRLFLERYVPGEAGKLFQEAIGINDKDANAYLG